MRFEDIEIINLSSIEPALLVSHHKSLIAYLHVEPTKISIQTYAPSSCQKTSPAATVGKCPSFDIPLISLRCALWSSKCSRNILNTYALPNHRCASSDVLTLSDDIIRKRACRSGMESGERKIRSTLTYIPHKRFSYKKI